MPRVRLKGKAKFANETERHIWEILQDLRAQRRRNPAGPWKAPKTIVGVLAVGQFRREMAGAKCHA